MSFAPRFISLEQVLRLNKGQIELFGGSHGVRDQGLLESALTQPEQGFGDEYANKDILKYGSSLSIPSRPEPPLS